MRLGRVGLRVVNGGDFRLDGGAMHGVVPKTLWGRLVPCDERNRVPYSTACLLVETAGRRVLVETGNGDKLTPRQRDIYGIAHEESIITALAAVGVAPETIDLVVLTHLHFDHAGGATRRAGRELVPTFPRARHVVQRRELQDALHPHERNRASYLPENILPLLEHRVLEEVEGEVEVAPGVRVVPTPGHTAGHQSVLIDGGDGCRALFLGDVVPTAVHVPLPYIMAYDLEPVVTLETKRALFARALAEGWLLVFGHDHAHQAATLRADEADRPMVGDYVRIE
ncbi:MAG TPA: MBL fold metallo-hydrolase [Polyangia bacterium]|jgi:glyoxylase-like metal-dependent hydrolase (beta-lactamase superfamily II)